MFGWIQTRGQACLKHPLSPALRLPLDAAFAPWQETMHRADLIKQQQHT